MACKTEPLLRYVAMPPRLTYPGVYVVERPSGVKTITGVATSTALFIGMARRGPLGEPKSVRNADQYEQTYGDDLTYGEMTIQVRQFFLNGGSNAIIVRAADPSASAARITLQSEAGTSGGGALDVLTLVAQDAGILGDEIRAVVDYKTPTPELTFNLELFRLSIDSNGAETISDTEIFRDLSMNPAHPRSVDTVLNNGSALVSVEPPLGTVSAMDRGFSQSGLLLDLDDGTALSTILGAAVGGSLALSIAVNDGAPVTATLPAVANGGDDQARLDDWLLESANAINANLAAGGQSGRVAAPLTLENFAGRRCLRITSQNGPNVVVTPAARNDVTGNLQLGNAAGGVETGAYSRRRPAPTGFVTRIHTADLGTLGQNSDLSRLEALAQATRTDLQRWSLSTGTGQVVSPPSNLSFGGAGTTFLEGNAFAGLSLRNVTTHLDTLAASLTAHLTATSGAPFEVQRYGYRIALTPRNGNSNAGLAATLSSQGGFNLGAAGNLAAASQAQNTKSYSLGVSGLPRRQRAGVGGNDGGPPGPADYDGIYTTVRREVDLFNLLILPRNPSQSDANRANLWGAASVFCAEQRAFLLVDPPSDGGAWSTVDEAAAGIANLRLGTVTDHAAIYWPRVRIATSPTAIDPCGTVAGIMARTDSRRGVWKAPAGLEATMLGARGLEYRLDDADNGVTNPLAINTNRIFPTGAVVYGARTMAGFDNSGESDYRYLPVRRLALFLEESLYRGLQFAVFEPNDEPLWARIRLAAGAFMQNLFRQGAFQGSKASDAYQVNCDETTTLQNDINLGRVNVIVRFAPLKPAEFVVLTIQQLAGQVTV